LMFQLCQLPKLSPQQDLLVCYIYLIIHCGDDKANIKAESINEP
jgi:hypothetical protein